MIAPRTTERERMSARAHQHDGAMNVGMTDAIALAPRREVGGVSFWLDERARHALPTLAHRSSIGRMIGASAQPLAQSMSPKSVQRFWANDVHQKQQLTAGRENLNSRDTH
jgi:hypothetical protein